MSKPKAKNKSFFEKFAGKITAVTGSSWGFGFALISVIIWAALGPFFDFSETWQLVINTGTTIITFLMVFVIQKSQNKDSIAIQLKLNELVAAHELASNRLVNVEDLTEDEMKVLRKYYVKLSTLTKEDQQIHQSHSIDEAEESHERKQHERKTFKKTNTRKTG